MKKRTLILSVLATLLVLSSSIGSAVAYFTTHASARGGYVIIGGRTEIKEDWLQGKKVVKISNVANSAADNGKYSIFVRVRAFYDSDLTISYSSDPDNSWEEMGDYWYYKSPIASGETTGALLIQVNTAANQKFKAGEAADVIVVYETVPAVFTPDGVPDPDTSWKTGEITIINPS